jgi:hypothetical protein
MKDAPTRLTNLRKDESDKKLEDARVKKNLDEGDEDIVARALANGDPTSIKDVTSMRSDQRLRVFAKAKQINPSFNTTTAKLKADTLEKYTNGKQADQIQSFGTFLGHAADVVRRCKQLPDYEYPSHQQTPQLDSQERGGRSRIFPTRDRPGSRARRVYDVLTEQPRTDGKRQEIGRRDYERRIFTRSDSGSLEADEQHGLLSAWVS